MFVKEGCKEPRAHHHRGLGVQLPTVLRGTRQSSTQLCFRKLVLHSHRHCSSSFCNPCNQFDQPRSNPYHKGTPGPAPLCFLNPTTCTSLS